MPCEMILQTVTVVALLQFKFAYIVMSDPFYMFHKEKLDKKIKQTKKPRSMIMAAIITYDQGKTNL